MTQFFTHLFHRESFTKLNSSQVLISMIFYSFLSIENGSEVFITRPFVPVSKNLPL